MVLQLLHIPLHQLINYGLVQNYDTSESKLRREFEVYGTVRKVKNITSFPR